MAVGQRLSINPKGTRRGTWAADIGANAAKASNNWRLEGDSKLKGPWSSADWKGYGGAAIPVVKWAWLGPPGVRRPAVGAEFLSTQDPEEGRTGVCWPLARPSHISHMPYHICTK